MLFYPMVVLWVSYGYPVVRPAKWMLKGNGLEVK